MTKANIVIALFFLGAVCFGAAWWIAVIGPAFGGANYNAWLAAGGFFATAAFLVERIR